MTKTKDTLMSRKEFMERVAEAEKEIREGKGLVFTNKADMNVWLNSF